MNSISVRERSSLF